MKPFDNYLFHPSSLGKIMTNGRNKSEVFGETCKSHLMECYVSHIYGRTKDITNKYMEKGTDVEEDSITLYSRVKKKFFKKNKDVIANDFFEGTPDLFEGESITKADVITDIKSPWDIFTFFSVLSKPLNKDYEWQLQGYMDLTGAEMGKLAYCLVNAPLKLINDEKRKLEWRMGVIDTDADPEYLAACEEIDRLMTYDDIPIEERWVEFTVPRNQEMIDSAHEKIELCREFLNELADRNQILEHV